MQVFENIFIVSQNVTSMPNTGDEHLNNGIWNFKALKIQTAVFWIQKP
jgi:hypothetical protein